MKHLFRQSARVVALALLVSSAAFSGVIINVFQSVGPTTDASGQLDTYLSNAEYALQHGLTSYGTPGTPGYYTEAAFPVDAGAIITTTFASWMANAFPTGNYANENGNELYFGVAISSTVAFSMSQVLFNSSLFGAGSLNDLCFNTHTVGSLSGVTATHDSTGAACGTGVTTNDASQLIDHFYYSGISLVDPTVVTSPADLAAEILNVAGTVGDVTYSLTTSDGKTTKAVTSFDLEPAVPEPGTTALLTLGFGLVLGLRRKLFATRVR